MPAASTLSCTRSPRPRRPLRPGQAQRGHQQRLRHYPLAPRRLRLRAQRRSTRDFGIHEYRAISASPDSFYETTACNRIRPRARTRRAGRSRYEARLAGHLGLSQSTLGCETPARCGTRSRSWRPDACAGRSVLRRGAVSAQRRAPGVADEMPVRQRRQVCIRRRGPARAWLLHAYSGPVAAFRAVSDRRRG